MAWYFGRAVIRVEARGALFGEARAEVEHTPKRTTRPLNLCSGGLARVVKEDTGFLLLVGSMRTIRAPEAVTVGL